MLKKYWPLLVFVLLAVYPAVPVLDWGLDAIGQSLHLDRQLVNIFIFAILALALNLQVGQAGLLQLGIAAFFALGAITTGVLTVDKYPFQLGFWGSLALAPAVAAAAGLLLGAPMLRLRGDYLAIVTLGFGEVVRVVLLNLENVTDGPRGLNPVPEPWLPTALRDLLVGEGARITVDPGKTLALTGNGQITIEGALTAHGGRISVLPGDLGEGQTLPVAAHRHIPAGGEETSRTAPDAVLVREVDGAIGAEDGRPRRLLSQIDRRHGLGGDIDGLNAPIHAEEHALAIGRPGG